MTLQQILRKFNVQGYSDPNAKYESNGKGGKVLKLSDGDYTYEDEFYGGEPYSGNETIWKNGQVIFRCVYWGKVAKEESFEQIYAFLRKALAADPDENIAHRGPGTFVEGELQYSNECKGTADEFELLERITKNGKEVYLAKFIGGLVDVKRA